MAREILDRLKIHRAILENIGGLPEYRRTVEEVQKAVEKYPIVVVGMRQNPYPQKARKLLKERGIQFHYLEYGSYFSEWHRRGALKMWTGWQTFPMIFVKGLFIGGYDDLKKLLDSGEFAKLVF